jgi:hypothetical protein
MNIKFLFSHKSIWRHTYLLAPWSRVLLEKLTSLCSQSRNSPHFMEPEVSLSYSQVPANCPYLEPTPPSPTIPSNFLKIHLNISSHLRLGLPNHLFPSGFPTNTLCTPHPSPVRATCHAHLILDFFTRKILGKEFRSFSSSSCNFLHSPVASPLLGPNTLLNSLFSNTLSLRFFLSVSDQVSHPYKTTGKISKLEDKRFCT